MQLTNFEESTHDGLHVLSATVRWEDQPRADQKLLIEASTDAVMTMRLSPAAFFPAAAVAAHVHDEQRIAVDGPLDGALAGGAQDLSVLLNAWNDTDREPLKVEFHEVTSPSLPPPRTISCITGGVDSTATIIDNHEHYPAGHPRRIQTGMIVYGLDASTEGDPRAPDEFLRQLADLLEVDLVAVRTNLRDLDPSVWFWWHNFQTATWSSIAHAFGDHVADLVIGATMRLGEAHQLRGCHPLLNDMLASTYLRLHEGVGRMTRLERLETVTRVPQALQHLQVCNEARDRWAPLNCGQCEKCLRTMLALESLDKLESSDAFPAGALTPDAIRSLRLADTYIIQYYAELLPGLSSVGRDDLVDATEAMIRRTRVDAALGVPKDVAKRLDARLLGGTLKRSVSALKGRLPS